jgi:Ca2+-dependent lipid-binding protein
MLQGMWPYYDKAIGAAIKEAVEPLMDQYKPPGLIKKIYFSKLTFGDAPIRIDNVWVEDEGEDHVLMEVMTPASTVHTKRICLKSCQGRTVHS